VRESLGLVYGNVGRLAVWARGSLVLKFQKQQGGRGGFTKRHLLSENLTHKEKGDLEGVSLSEKRGLRYFVTEDEPSKLSCTDLRTLLKGKATKAVTNLV